eukprot:6186262-Pleurochrysis_carterae.AAC.2
MCDEKYCRQSQYFEGIARCLVAGVGRSVIRESCLSYGLFAYEYGWLAHDLKIRFKRAASLDTVLPVHIASKWEGCAEIRVKMLGKFARSCRGLTCILLRCNQLIRAEGQSACQNAHALSRIQQRRDLTSHFRLTVVRKCEDCIYIALQLIVSHSLQVVKLTEA